MNAAKNAAIGADSARVAGLLIDLLQKLRSGQVSVDHLWRFLNLSWHDRENRFGEREKQVVTDVLVGKSIRFSMICDLGILTVPEDYVHERGIEDFLRKHRKNLYYHNSEISDENFPNPACVLTPGDRFHVRVFKPAVGVANSEECLSFLREQNAVYVGMQGSSLVFDQKRDLLPRGMQYASFSESDRLWGDPSSHRMVPTLLCRLDGGFALGLGSFEIVWSRNDAFFCFCKILEPSAPAQA